jgi:C4-dicarboxylate transporter DctM subunit
MTTFLVGVCLAALLVLGVPIAVSLALAGGFTFLMVYGPTLGVASLAHIPYDALSGFVVAAVPLYMFMGQLMLEGGIGRDLFDFAEWCAGRLPGGLVLASILACAIFAAISGSTAATVASIGVVALPEMLRRGYGRPIAAGALACAGGLGILIPPSITFILYASVTNVSVGKLFMAGVVPGIMLAILYSVYVVLREWWRPSPGIMRIEQDGQPHRVRLHWGMAWGILTVPLLLGGIYVGWYTPTEGAAMGVGYALLVTVVFKRSLKWDGFVRSVRAATSSSAMILAIIVGAKIFGTAISLLHVPQDVVAWMDGLNLHTWQFLIAINILFLILGCFLDAAAVVLVTVPILLPTLQLLHIDLIWFGVILVINMELGAITPPVGVNLYVIQAIRRDYSIGEILNGALPFALIGLSGLALVMIFPEIALWLTHGVK